jgi:hypothetical protein
MTKYDQLRVVAMELAVSANSGRSYDNDGRDIQDETKLVKSAEAIYNFITTETKTNVE